MKIYCGQFDVERSHPHRKGWRTGVAKINLNRNCKGYPRKTIFNTMNRIQFGETISDKKKTDRKSAEKIDQ